ncbi:Protein of unknown function, partial [Gryllus bimaculatus]
CESSPIANFIAVSKRRYQVGIRLPRGNIFLTSGRKSSFKEQGEEKEENNRKYALKRKVTVQLLKIFAFNNVLLPHVVVDIAFVAMVSHCTCLPFLL